MTHTLHQRSECKHGFVHAQCRCPSEDKYVQIVDCSVIPAHGQRMEELGEAERTKYPLLVHDGKAWVPMEVKPPPFDWKELNLIEDALSYFKLSCEDGLGPEEWTTEDCMKLLEKIVPMRENAGRAEYEGAPF